MPSGERARKWIRRRKVAHPGKPGKDTSVLMYCSARSIRPRPIGWQRQEDRRRRLQEHRQGSAPLIRRFSEGMNGRTLSPWVEQGKHSGQAAGLQAGGVAEAASTVSRPRRPPRCALRFLTWTVEGFHSDIPGQKAACTDFPQPEGGSFGS